MPPLLVSELGTRPMKIQSQTFERLVLGQLFETTGPREGQDLPDHYIAVIEGKTGSPDCRGRRVRLPAFGCLRGGHLDGQDLRRAGGRGLPAGGRRD